MRGLPSGLMNSLVGLMQRLHRAGMRKSYDNIDGACVSVWHAHATFSEIQRHPRGKPED